MDTESRNRAAAALLQEAEQERTQMIADRRALHRNPETGIQLPQTKAYVRRRLSEMGYAPEELCESGLVATITGQDTGRCILLRADMDALRIKEQTDLPFRSENGCMHACGHDLHTAMLLGAAGLLQKHRSALRGTVKLVFQPDEEGFTGAKAMLKAGVLRDPAPQAALALHVHSGTPTGVLLCGRGTFMAGCTLFRITVRGVGCHGAMPETGVDPINIAAHIYLALQELVSRELPAKTAAVVTVGKFRAGEAPNIIPGEAVLEGTIRTFDRELSETLFHRIETIARSTAEAFRGSAAVEELASAPPLVNNPDLVNALAEDAALLLGQQRVALLDEGGMASEDFAAYTYDLPCAYFMLGAGSAEENPMYGRPMHNEKVIFNEDVLPLGAALHTWCAIRWLQGDTL